MVQSDDSLSSIRERTGGERPWCVAGRAGDGSGGRARACGRRRDRRSSAAATTRPSPHPAGRARPRPASGDHLCPGGSRRASPRRPAHQLRPAVEGDVYVYYVMDAGRPGCGSTERAAGDGAREEPPQHGARASDAPRQTAVDPDYEDAVAEGHHASSATRSTTRPRRWTSPTSPGVPPPRRRRAAASLHGHGQRNGREAGPAAGRTASPPDRRAGRADRPVAADGVQGLIWLLGPTEGATRSSPVEIRATARRSRRGQLGGSRAGSDDAVAEGLTNAGANGGSPTSATRSSSARGRTSCVRSSRLPRTAAAEHRQQGVHRRVAVDNPL